MTQYLMHKNKDYDHLQYALDNYKALNMMISPFSMGNSKLLITRNLENTQLRFELDNGLKLLTDKELTHFSLNGDYRSGFKLEYRQDNDMRIYPYFNDPNDSQMPLPAKSVFRKVIDDSLLEITFSGKILLELDELVDNKLANSYWKLVKK